MPLSRRKFLSHLGMAAGAHAMPGPLPRLLAGMAEVPAAAVVAPVAAVSESLLSAVSIERIVGALNGSWDKFYEALAYDTKVQDASALSLHGTIAKHLDHHLPAFFSAATQYRAVMSQFLAGADGARLEVLHSALDAKRTMHIEDIDQLVRFFSRVDNFDEEGEVQYSGDCIWIDPDLSDEELKDIYGDKLQENLLAHLENDAIDLRDEEIHADYRDGLFAQLKNRADGFIKMARRANSVDADFEASRGARHKEIYQQLEALCQPVNASAETVDALTNFLPELISSGDELAETEITTLLEGNNFLEHMAKLVGRQVNQFLIDYKKEFGASLTQETLTYIRGGLQKDVQGIYRRHFIAAMPDVTDIPLPEVTVDMSDLAPDLLEEAEAEETAVQSETVADTVEAEETGAATLSPLRAVSSAIARMGEAEETPDPTLAQEEGAAFPPTSPSILMENAGIGLPQASPNPAPAVSMA